MTFQEAIKPPREESAALSTFSRKLEEEGGAEIRMSYVDK